jgi:hypothetical protein
VQTVREVHSAQRNGVLALVNAALYSKSESDEQRCSQHRRKQDAPRPSPTCPGAHSERIPPIAMRHTSLSKVVPAIAAFGARWADDAAFGTVHGPVPGRPWTQAEAPVCRSCSHRND